MIINWIIHYTQRPDAPGVFSVHFMDETGQRLNSAGPQRGQAEWSLCFYREREGPFSNVTLLRMSPDRAVLRLFARGARPIAVPQGAVVNLRARETSLCLGDWWARKATLIILAVLRALREDGDEPDVLFEIAASNAHAVLISHSTNGYRRGQ